MESMEITRLDASNFTENSLDDFSRYQEVTQVYRLIDGRLQLVPLTFTEDWPLARRREKAREILRGTHIVYGAVENGEVLGVIMLLPALDYGRMVIDSFHVSANHRRNGIGRALFKAAKAEAIRRGAKALYASACSARETIDFYRAMGFVISPNPIPESRAMCSWNAPFEQRIKRVRLPSAERTRFLLRENATFPEIC